MGRRSSTGGVAPRGAGIQLTFYWQTERRRLTLALAPNAANLKHAHRVLAEIKEKIRVGTFSIDEYFPRAAAKIPAALAPKGGLTFAAAAKAYMESPDVADKEYSTRVGYQRILDTYWMPKLGTIALRDITPAKMREVIAEFTVERKTRNNVLTPARGVFDLAVDDEIIAASPLAKVKNAKVQKEPPDPFEIEEVDAILAKMAERYDAQLVNYFEFAFFTGLRPSEQIALLWGDVDKARGSVTIRRATVWKREKERTKTFTVRDVELTARALAAIERQRQHTLLAGGLVFLNPVTGKPWAGLEHQRRMFQRTLTAAGIRYREPYQTRHTFATQALMAGANPMWVARQLGHRNMGMLLKTYSRWIDRADKSREVGKLNAAFGTTTATTEQRDDANALIPIWKVGGVDGTRTR